MTQPAALPRTRSTFNRLLGYLLRRRMPLILALSCMVVYSFVLARLSLLAGLGTNIMLNPNGTLQQLWGIALQLILVSLLIFVLGYLSQWLLSQICQSALQDLRIELFNHLQEMSLNFFDRQPVGQLLSRLTSDIDAVDLFFRTGVWTVIQAVLNILAVIIYMFALDYHLTFIVLLSVPALFGLVTLITRISGPGFTHLQEQVGEMSGFLEENLAAQKVVIAYRAQDRMASRLEELSLAVQETGAKAQFVSLLTGPIVTVISNLVTILTILVGAFYAIEGAISLGVIVSMLGYIRQINGPLAEVFRIYNQIIAAMAGAQRVFHLLDELPVVVDTPGAPVLPPVRGEVRFRDVNFSYTRGRPVLRHNTFEAQPGQLIGLCGPTGAGKSTIINILTRYYDIDSGSITVDEQRVDSVQQDSLRLQIAQVLQEPFLFSATVMDNLRYARLEASDEQCIAAAQQANAHDFVTRLPQGYLTLLNDGGANLSQGQRQMLTIARAMVAFPHLLILDEATSNVDTRTEKLIQEGLLKLQQGKTSFVIAHRLSTIRRADKIMVIDHGEIIESGSHDQLMEQKGFYYNLFISQFHGKLPEAGL